ncbi:MAG: hypothetical protein H0W53_08935 [Acidobacteria bacterium]|nr:hypothetical protein [Acidobacteriota bacterium]
MPFWARLVDGLVVALVALAGFVLVFGGFTLELASARLSSHSIFRPLLIALVLATVRHARCREQPLHHRLRAWATRFAEAPRSSLMLIVLGSRFAVLAVGFFAVISFGIPKEGPFVVSRDPLANLPARYDAGWYGGIATDGYRVEGGYDLQQNFAFFPAYPMLMRVGGYALGAFDERASNEQRTGRALWAGTLISIAAFAWALAFLHRLTVEMIGLPEANVALALIAAYPFAVFFSAPYTESLFLLAAVAAFYRFRRQEWLSAAAWGLLVGLTRPNGCMLSVVLVCIIGEHLWQRRRSAAREPYNLPLAAMAAAAPGIGMLAFAAYVRSLTGDWLGWIRVQQAWGRDSSAAPSIPTFINWLNEGVLLNVISRRPDDSLNAVGLIFVVLMLWPVFRHVGFAAAMFVVVNIGPAVLSGGVLSIGRLSATMFPVFIALAALLPRLWLVPLVIAWALGQGLVAALFFTWRPPF